MPGAVIPRVRMIRDTTQTTRTTTTTEEGTTRLLRMHTTTTNKKSYKYVRTRKSKEIIQKRKPTITTINTSKVSETQQSSAAAPNDFNTDLERLGMSSLPLLQYSLAHIQCTLARLYPPLNVRTMFNFRTMDLLLHRTCWYK